MNTVHIHSYGLTNIPRNNKYILSIFNYKNPLSMRLMPKEAETRSLEPKLEASLNNLSIRSYFLPGSGGTGL